MAVGPPRGGAALPGDPAAPAAAMRAAAKPSGPAPSHPVSAEKGKDAALRGAATQPPGLARGSVQESEAGLGTAGHARSHLGLRYFSTS